MRRKKTQGGTYGVKRSGSGSQGGGIAGRFQHLSPINSLLYKVAAKLPPEPRRRIKPKGRRKGSLSDDFVRELRHLHEDKGYTADDLMALFKDRLSSKYQLVGILEYRNYTKVY